MTIIKKMLSVFAAAAISVSLFGCNSNSGETSTADSSASESSAAENTAETTADTDNDDVSEELPTVQAEVPVEYEKDSVNDGCADVINKYFTSIINQDYDGYKDCLDPYYFEVYSAWLDGNYGYGMETSFETMHQNIMDAAESANGGNSVDNVVITNLKLDKAYDEGSEEGENAIADYMQQYDDAIGNGFSEELKAQCDDIISVKFTMTADCDGKELEILTEMELLMAVHGNDYKIIG